MSTLDRYKRYFERGETEFVLETAAADKSLSDAEYAQLHKARLALEKRPGKALLDLADRDFAITKRPGGSNG